MTSRYKGRVVTLIGQGHSNVFICIGNNNYIIIICIGVVLSKLYAKNNPEL